METLDKCALVVVSWPTASAIVWRSYARPHQVAGSEEEATMRINRTSGSLVRMRRLFIVMVLALSALSLSPLHAATDVVYVAATGHYMRGVFRDFWDKN